MNRLVTTRVRTTAVRLGLPQLAARLEQYLAHADGEAMGHLEFLDLVLREEFAVRDERHFHSRLRRAQLPYHKTLDEYDFAFQPGLDQWRIHDLVTLDFVQDRGNVALLGPPGVGKTHLAVALAVAACRAGFTVRFVTLDDLVQSLWAGARAGRPARKLDSYLQPDLLVVDEVGYRRLGRDEAELAFQVISKRYEKGSTVVTSNRSLDEWGRVFGDEDLAAAILDRVLHRCEIVTIDGPSYRRGNGLAAVTAQVA